MWVRIKFKYDIIKLPYMLNECTIQCTLYSTHYIIHNTQYAIHMYGAVDLLLVI